MNQKPVETIAAAGNTEIPCYLAIKSLGFDISKAEVDTTLSAAQLWVAENSEFRFLASSHLELLGLISMRKIRGQNWKAEDREIDDYFEEHESHS
ncbi:hypothetical protein [Gimesia sp.]|uniref:hypothetical protein n=1 Tax=Gimesia sp. TaxID=2024833 RepID=UPI000C3ABB73|nr:hypothetical protein [Gimesia sp.]MAX38555.1 hypothetical protein [Gimesia sp.]HAH44670.1 hypothetical protein [Planctomycetaceae bacterium]HBL44459.1 hypothetical protein [Planctomycetaceae bacterium]|tara:strand:+ start:144 stop:428 length:285 start_codon:yes stop_codon:yes gene_type:complete